MRSPPSSQPRDSGPVPRLADVDLNLLLVLDALLRERSVTRAGTALALSQPAASHALARLRELFDDELLVRRGHEMEPTALADALVGPLRDALGAIEELLWNERAFDAATADRELAIAV